MKEEEEEKEEEGVFNSSAHLLNKYVCAFTCTVVCVFKPAR